MKIKQIITIFILICPILIAAQSTIQKKENQYYTIKEVPIPKDIILEVGGLAFDDKGTLGVTTRRGDLWTIKNPSSTKPEFTRFASGLHEPLGLAYRDGAYYLSQRAELTKIQDQSGDGRADIYETIYSWPLNGNYHEYSYGPEFLPDGNMLVTLNLGWIGRGESGSKWRGWLLQITPEGEMTPVATGLRSPAGFGLNAKGDVFYTENQGDWVGSGRMTHLEKGDFAGNPEGLKWSQEPGSPVKIKFEEIVDTMGYTLYEYSKKKEGIKPPSVWFPHTLMGISTSDILVVNNDKFGPFEGQLLVADQGHSKIMRVFQEKINGVYQGVCFPFREGFASGILRMEWGPDNSIFVGQTNRGWASTGKASYALERLVYNGRAPFEMKTIKATKEGFDIEFTEPVNRATAADPASYKISDFTYKYHHVYGSPVTDLQIRTVYKVSLSQDGKTAKLFVEGLRAGYINEVKAEGIKNTSGKKLLHNFGYYTLNEIPGGGGTHDPAAHVGHDAIVPAVNLISDKRVTEMPSSWFNGPDVTLTLTTAAGMKYVEKELSVKAGQKVKFVLNNPDDMMHNVAIVKPGKVAVVADLANNLGLQGQEKGYIPESDDLLFHSNLLVPGSSDIFYFVAPSEPGGYEYVCTFPAHSTTMRGILKVVK